MNNAKFLNLIGQSFKDFLDSTTSRSTNKLKKLHGEIAQNLQTKLGSDFEIKSLGYGDDKEGKISGRYFDKKVDITISKNGKIVAGYGVKFVMQNYS